MHSVARRLLRFTLPVLALSVLAMALLHGPAAARRPYKTAFMSVYPNAVNSRLNNLPSKADHCGVCHYDFNGSGPKNPYGSRLEQVLPNHATTALAIQAIQNEDPDGDGYSSLTEITNTTTYSNTPTFPGLTPANVGSVVNVPNLSELTPYLVPTQAVDTTPPTVTVTSPNGGESWVGDSSHLITWTANDNVGVSNIDVHFKEFASDPWQPLALAVPNSGSFTWFVHNLPTTAARVRIVARDLAGNAGRDSSDANFTIVRRPGGVAPTTLRDFKQGGTQPLGTSTVFDHTACIDCHGGYDTANEPGHQFLGTMMAQAMRDPLFHACLAVAEQDAPGAGDLCIRCHSPAGWLGGRSTPTSGAQLNATDRDGVNCDFCHRMVDPVYKPGVSPTQDQAVLAGLLAPAHSLSNGQYVIDPDGRKRGPFSDAAAPHPFLQSNFHLSADLCGTCHEVSSPVFERVAGDDYAPNTFDAKADSIVSAKMFPLERTYSEWKNSAYPAGVFAPDFAGNRPDGTVRTCQDCHMRDVEAKGCNDPLAPLRPNLPLHDQMGGNSWMPNVIAATWAGEVDAAALADASTRATTKLQKAATLGVNVAAEGDSFRATVTITNRAGHKLPTGYPEGRRMWLGVRARDAFGNIVFESGAYDFGEGELTHDAHLAIYEAELGISPALGGALGLPHGKSFHFAINDSMYKDTRIPPLGFTNAAYDAFGGRPVDPHGPSPRYADGQNWDAPSYPLPGAARSVAVILYYQTTSKEYVEFLRDQNTTNTAGDDLYAVWQAFGRSAPVVMVSDSVTITPVGVPEDVIASRLDLRAQQNPFAGKLALTLDLVRGAPVALDVYDARGRHLARRDYGTLPAGVHRLDWSGQDRAGADAGPGVFWAVARVGNERLVRQVVRLR